MNQKKMLADNSYSVCCTPEPTDYNDLGVEDQQKFGLQVNQLSKKGHSLAEAQKIAYQKVTCDSIPFELTGR